MRETLIKQRLLAIPVLTPVFDSNTIDNVIGVGNCGGTVSQQAESGQASTPITHQTVNPTIEVQSPQPTEPPPPPVDTATLVVIKKVVCPSGFTCPDPSDFKMSVSQDNVISEFPGSATGTEVTLQPGEYGSGDKFPPTPDGLDIFAKPSADCDSNLNGPIQAGEIRTCTWTNTYEPK
jgi:hypothetical protein